MPNAIDKLQEALTEFIEEIIEEIDIAEKLQEQVQNTIDGVDIEGQVDDAIESAIDSIDLEAKAEKAIENASANMNIGEQVENAVTDQLEDLDARIQEAAENIDIAEVVSQLILQGSFDKIIDNKVTEIMNKIQRAREQLPDDLKNAPASIAHDWLEDHGKHEEAEQILPTNEG